MIEVRTQRNGWNIRWQSVQADKVKRQQQLHARLARLAQAFSNGLVGIILLMSLCTCMPALAQISGTATLQGTVTDSTGAALPGATVEATAVSTGRIFVQKTSQAGIYSLNAMDPGEYTVEVRANGFKVYRKEHLIIQAVTVTGLDPSLQPGAGSETVYVNQETPELNTETGTLSTTIPNTSYSELPLVMDGGIKSPVGFLNLVPGSNAGTNSLAAPSLNGGAGNTSHLYVNGLPLLASELQGDLRQISELTPTEVVDSFQVITSGVPAYYEGQGITNLVYKSGANTFHGSAFENFRNTALDATGYQLSPALKPVEHQNEFGATFSGRIKKDRVFFFGAYDGYRITQGTLSQLFSIPTLAERQGDFSALSTPIYDPATTVCTSGVCTRQAFPGNIIPQSRLSGISKSFESYLPQPINANLQNNYSYQYVSGSANNSYTAKTDAQITKSDHGTLLFQALTNDPKGNSGLVGLPIPYNDGRIGISEVYLGQISETHLFSQNLLNLFGFSIFQDPGITKVVTAAGNYPGKAGFTGLPGGVPSTGFPPIVFSGGVAPLTTWGGPGGSSSQAFTETSQVEYYQDNVQWTHGRHNLTFGGEANIQQENVSLPSVINQIGFQNLETAGFQAGNTSLDSTTGHPYASYLLGLVDNVNASDTTLSVQGARYKQFALYAQDDWQLTPKLTVNLGLRWTLPLPYVEAQNRISWLNPNQTNPITNSPGALVFAGYGSGKCNCRTDVKTHYLTFGPRVGFAYHVHQNSVVRGSFGIVNFNGAALGGGGLSFGVSTLGYTTSASKSSPDSGVNPAFVWDNGYPTYTHPPVFDSGLSTGFNTTTPGDQGGVGYDRPETAGRSPYTENWSLTVEQQLPAAFVLQLSYGGSASHFISQGGGVGIYSDQIDPSNLILGGLLTQDANPANIAAAQKILPSFKLPYANFAGTIGQALRPFPQYDGSGANFAGMDPWANFGTSSYNALQTQLSRRMGNGLYVQAAYTWSKLMDQGAATVNFIVSPARSAYQWNHERSLSAGDTPHVISLAWVYHLPFGKGQNFVLNNEAANLVAGGWQLSAIQQYSSGQPLGTFYTGACNVPYTGGCYADFAGNTVRVKLGNIGSGDPKTATYVNANAFSDPAAYTFGTTPRNGAYGLRNQWNADEDLALAKDFSIYDRLTFRFQADAFNIFNRTVFGGLTTNIDSPSFGQVTAQENTPRRLQLEGYFRF